MSERGAYPHAVSITYVTTRERADLIEAMWDLPTPWPTFMQQDVVADFVYDLLPMRYPEFQIVALDGERVIGRINAVPFAWTGQDDDLPETGWDSVLGMAFRPEMPAEATAVSLIEARIHPDGTGQGIGVGLLLAARDNARALGYPHLLAPIRPTLKSLEPHVGIDAYVTRTREDGAPFDPWLRAHLRLGGRLVRVCHSAMTISGSLEEWRQWTGLPFDTSGTVVVGGALNPVHVSVENDYAVYVEPNVWIDHRTG
jgi:GNAT superfamily N-acetyltransferase